MSGSRSRWTRAGGHEVHARCWEERRETPAVVLVHGVGISSSYMIPLGGWLSRDFRVYAPDLPGYGLSSKPEHLLGLRELAAALSAWVSASGLERVSLLGNSFGCQVIVEFAARWPEQVERVVLQGPTVDPAARTLRQQLWRWLRDTPREPTSQAPLMLRDYRRCGARRVFKAVAESLRDPIEEKLPRVEAPALVVRGTRDPLVPRRWAEEAAGRLPRGRLLELPGATHAANYSAPLQLSRVVRPFLLERDEETRRL